MKTCPLVGKVKEKSKASHEKVKQFCYLRSLVTEDSSCCEVRRIALGKEAFNKKRDLMLISQPSSAKTYGCLLYTSPSPRD